MAEKQSGYQDAGNRFTTDPTTLTTAQLLREVGSLKELVFSKLEGIEKGIDVAHDDLVRVPTEVQKQIAALREVVEGKFGVLEIKICDADKLNQEKFKNIDKMLDTGELARIEQKRDTATAVDAALKAAKEAVTEQNASNVLAINKSEAAMTKQMDQQAALLSQIKGGLEDKINDIKIQMGMGQGKTQGGKDIMDIIKLIILIGGFILTYFIVKK